MQAMSLGWELALPIFAGVLAGHLMDRWLGTGYIFTMGFLVLGIAAGYYNVARTIRRIERRRKKEDDEQ
jgi:ATP synthase protein I